MKIVFVQVEDDDVGEIAEMLSSIQQIEYHFAVLPMSAKILDVDFLQRLIKNREAK